MDAKKVFNPPFHYSSTSSDYFLSRDSWSSMAVLSRENCEITVEAKSFSGKVKECFGFLGVIHLQNASYLVVITEAKFIAILHHCYIFLISSVDLLPLTSLKDIESVQQFRDFIAANSFYFSYNYDLTNALDRSFKLRDGSSFENYDEKYFWNFFITQEFRKAQVKEIIIGVISGFIQIEQVSVDGVTMDYGLISRRDHRRAGTRFHTRGLDQFGFAANFVETEQILGWSENGTYRLHSYVQIRGSIPLVWTQKPNLAWSPPVKIDLSMQDPSVKHMHEMAQLYKNVTYINLVDKKGSQLRLGQAFQKAVEKVDKGTYVWFDFHHECRGMKYENLANLVEMVNSQLFSYEWNEAIITEMKGLNNGNISKVQQGVFRTNCVDCLDRTNVVQSVMARAIMHRQLETIIHKTTSDPLAAFPPLLEFCFRSFWTNNADALSKLYTGTPAQKTDFTRTGKRTNKGLVNDLQYGLTRYVINNFMDGSKKNVIDAFLGNLKSSKLAKPNNLWNIGRFVCAIILIFIFCNLLATQVGDGLWYYFAFFGTFALMAAGLKSFGSRLVENPVLP